MERIPNRTGGDARKGCPRPFFMCIKWGREFFIYIGGGISRHAQIKTPDPFIDRPVRNLSTGWWMLGSKHPVQPGNYFLLRVLLPVQTVPMRVDRSAVRLSSGGEFG